MQVDGDGFDAESQTWLLLVATTPSSYNMLQPLTCKSDLFRWMWTETMLNRQSFQGAPLGIAKEEMGSRHDSLGQARGLPSPEMLKDSAVSQEDSMKSSRRGDASHKPRNQGLQAALNVLGVKLSVIVLGKQRKSTHFPSMRKKMGTITCRFAKMTSPGIPNPS